MSAKSNSALTGLRAIFCVSIVLFHYTDFPTQLGFPYLTPLAKPLGLGNWGWIRNANLGVYFFFVLSGYLLAQKYLSPGAKLVAPFVFLKRRAFRIFPLHISLLLLYAVFIAASLYDPGETVGSIRFSLTSFWKNTLLIQNWFPRQWDTWNYPAWTLSSQWLFYVLFAGLLSKSKRLSASLGLTLLVGISVAAPFLNPTLLVNDLVAFGIGVLGGYMQSRIQFKLPPPRSKLLTIITQLIFANAMVIAMSRGVTALPLSVLFLGLVLSLSSTASGPSRLAALLSSQPFTWIGERSFSLYLLHIPALELSAPLFRQMNSSIALGLHLALLLLLTSLSYAFFERSRNDRVA